MQHNFDWDEISHAEKIERWENVLRVLNGLSEHERQHHWDMRAFGTRNACGTVACAAGHCGLDPWFRERNFQLNFLYAGPVDENGEPTQEGMKNERNWNSHISDVAVFFGDGSLLFYDSTPRPAMQVIHEVHEHLEALREDEDAIPGPLVEEE